LFMVARNEAFFWGSGFVAFGWWYREVSLGLGLFGFVLVVF
jgi:hypothetical protein